MGFDENKGSKWIAGRLKDSVNNDSVFHAYLFEGQDQTERMLLAKNFAKAILCEGASGDACESCLACRKISHGNHEDIILIAQEGSSIKDEAIIELQSRLAKKPCAGERTIAIIDQADSMTPKAQNRLLKTLEEPLGKNIIILLAENAGNLALTINSRCILYRIPISGNIPMTEMMNDNYHLIEFAKGIAEHRPLYMLSKDLKEIAQKRETALTVLEILEGWFRDMLMLSFGSPRMNLVNTEYLSLLKAESRLCHQGDLIKIIQSLEDTKAKLNKNINVSYALKSMLLKIQEEKDGKSSRNQI